MVVVVGAGPAGLATGYYLQQKKIPYTILEKHSVGYAWQNHYDSLRLHTLKQVSALPGLPMPKTYPRFPSRQQVLQYLRDYAEHFHLIIKEGVQVQEAIYHKYHHEWHIKASRGEYLAEILVVATGIWSTPHRPELPGEAAFGGEILHANDYQNAEPFKGKKVLVVGAGNSGTEIAVELAESDIDTSIVVRSGTSFIPYPESTRAVELGAWMYRHLPDRLGSVLLARSRRKFDHLGLPWPNRPLSQVYPVVGYELPDAVEKGKVAVYQSEIQQLGDHKVTFKDGHTDVFDVIIMATGYRPTIDFIRGELELNHKGWPLLKNWHSVKNDRLYCVGFSYPSTEGWLQALPRVANEAVNHMAKKLQDA